MAADSLGVKTPLQMPPMMRMGIISAGPAARVADQICAGVLRASPLSQPVRLPCHMHTRISATADSSAGTIPAMDSVRMDTPEMKAYTKNGIDSGINRAKVPATAKRAAAKPRE